MKKAAAVRSLLLIFLTTLPLISFSQIADQDLSIEEILRDSIIWDDYFILSDIPNRSQQTLDFLSSIETELSGKDIENIFKNEWDSVSAEIVRKDQEFVLDSTTRLGPSAIQNRLLEWSVVKKKISDWNDELTEDIGWIGDKQVLFDRLKVIWNKTRANAISEQGAPEVVGRISEVRNRVAADSRKLNSTFNALLKRQVELSNLIATVDKKIDGLETAREYTVKSYLVPDRPVLWVELQEISDSSAVFKENFNIVIQNRKSDFSRYFYSNRYNMLAGLLLFIAITFTLIVLQRRSRSWFDNYEEGTDYVNATIKIINRPIPVGFILAILITSSLLLQDVPIFFADFLWFIALVPLLVILLPVAPKQFHPYIIALSVVAIVNRIDNLIYELPIIARMVILINSILITGILIWMTWKSIGKNIIERTLLKNILNLIRIFGLIAMPLAILSNIIGNTTLSEFLVNGYVDSLLAVLLITILMLVLRSLNDVILLSPGLRKINVVRNHAQQIEDSINRIVYWVLTIYLISFLADAFLVEEWLINALKALFLTPLEFGSVSITLGDIALLFFTLWISFRISKIVSVILEEDILVRAKATKGVSATIVSMTKTLIIVIGFILAIAATGFELSSITLLVSAFGVGIGFGLQNIFNNFVSGIIIATERPVEVGDTIQVGQLTGSVKSVGLRSSVVRTWDGSEVIVPNGNLISNDLINWTHSDRQIRLSIPFGVAYGTDPHLTIEIATKAATEHKSALKYPAPYTLFIGFGDSSLDFMLRFWTDDYDNWIFIKSDVTLKVHDALYENGIEIPFPQRDLHLKSVHDIVSTSEISPEISQRNLQLLEKKHEDERKAGQEDQNKKGEKTVTDKSASKKNSAPKAVDKEKEVDQSLETDGDN